VMGVASVTVTGVTMGVVFMTVRRVRLGGIGHVCDQKYERLGAKRAGLMNHCGGANATPGQYRASAGWIASSLRSSQ
jgi:hypothetical protein